MAHHRSRLRREPLRARHRLRRPHPRTAHRGAIPRRPRRFHSRRPGRPAAAPSNFATYASPTPPKAENRSKCFRASRSKFLPAPVLLSSAPPAPARLPSSTSSLVSMTRRLARSSSTAAPSASIRSTRCCAAVGFVPQETFLFSTTIRENIAFGVEGPDSAASPEPPTAAHIRDETGLPQCLRHHGRRTRPHSFRRTKTAHGPRPRHPAQSPHPHPRRRPRQRRYVDRGTHPRGTAYRHGGTHHHPHLPPHLDRPPRGPYRRPVRGRIAELGTHEELLALNGYYAGLFQKQLLEEELAVTG